AAERLLITWRRSLQLRVGATTVVLAGVVVLLIGLFLVDKVSGGVLRAKRDAAIDQARVGLSVARPILQDVDVGVASEVSAARQQMLANLTAGGTSAGTFTIVIESPLGGAEG